MTRLSRNEQEALGTLQEIAAALRVPMVLIGAEARLLLVDARLTGKPLRSTKDWDFAVHVQSWSDFQKLRQTLIATGQFASTGAAHRMLHVTNVQIDLVPFGGVEQDGKIVWPESGETMNVIGLEEACEHTEPINLSLPEPLRVVAVSWLVVLKFFAYSDRKERSNKDLEDIVFILRNYLKLENNEDRIFDEFDDLLADGTVEHAVAGPFLLGLDVGRSCKESILAQLRPILEACLDPYGRDINSVLGVVADSDLEEQRREQLGQAFRALRSGIARAGQSSASGS